MYRFYVINEKRGLVAVLHDPAEAEDLAIRAAVNGGTTYLHDRLTELS